MILQCANKKIYLLLRRLELYRVHPKYTKAIKIIIAFVLGALLLAGLYALVEIPYTPQHLLSVSNRCSTIRANLPLLLQGGLFIALLLTATIFDIRKRIIPDTICLAVALTGFILFEPIKLLGILAALPFLLAALFFGGMGGGDIKLMAASGIVLGITGGIAASVLALTAMLLFYAVYSTVQRLRNREYQKSFPLAPFLSIGCIAIYFMNIGGIAL